MRVRIRFRVCAVVLEVRALLRGFRHGSGHNPPYPDPPRAPPLPFLVPLAIPSLAPTRQVPSEYAVSVLSAHARCWTRQLQTAWSKVRKVHPAEPPRSCWRCSVSVALEAGAGPFWDTGVDWHCQNPSTPGSPRFCQSVAVLRGGPGLL